VHSWAVEGTGENHSPMAVSPSLAMPNQVPRGVKRWALRTLEVGSGLCRDVWELASETPVAPVLRRYSNKVQPDGLQKLVVLTQTDYEEFADIDAIRSC